MRICVVDFMPTLLYFILVFSNKQFMLFLCFTLARGICMYKEDDIYSIIYNYIPQRIIFK